jgi:hypothetical protein
MWRSIWIGDCIQKHSYPWNTITYFLWNFWHDLMHQIWDLSKVGASTKSYFMLLFSSKWGRRNSMVKWWQRFLHNKKILIGLMVNSACIIPKYAFSLEIDFVYSPFFFSIEGWVLEYHSQWKLFLKQQGFYIPGRFNSKLKMRHLKGVWHVTSWVNPVRMARTDSTGKPCTTYCVKGNRTTHVCLCQ